MLRYVFLIIALTLVSVLTSLILTSAIAAPPIDVLRIAIASSDAEGNSATRCISKDQAASGDAQSYIDHLQSRFREQIILCLTDDHAMSANLLAKGEADIAWVSADGFASIKEDARPFMTLRPHDGIGRVEAVIFSRAKGSIDSIGGLVNQTIGLLGQPPLSLNKDLVKRVLLEQGQLSLEEMSFTSFKTMPEIADAVRTGDIMAGAVEVTAWARYCHLLDPAPTRCADLQVLARAYPRADEAMVISDRLPKEYLYRMLSVHSMMHFEAPLAFEWISRGTGKEFEPTEASAFSIKTGTGY
ncbi:MAG: PhnD/SsuA/transferrin family substrate-binding protein [Pseudomonadota bacterium]